MEEIWKDIPGHEGLYQASTIGQIKSLTCKVGRIIKQIKTIPNGRILSPRGKDDWYNTYILYKDGIASSKIGSRLVALTFLPNPENKPCVNHINGIKHDDRIENLEWVTYKENSVHAINTGLRKNFSSGVRHYLYNKHGKDHPSSRPVLQLRPNDLKIINEFSSCVEASKSLGCTASSIAMAARKERLTLFGFIWEYKSS